MTLFWKIFKSLQTDSHNKKQPKPKFLCDGMDPKIPQSGG